MIRFVVEKNQLNDSMVKLKAEPFNTSQTKSGDLNDCSNHGGEEEECFSQFYSIL